ncbi:MAG: MoaD/ThiS family protein [Nevskia sp.]|nr:MoaD/ThiS family protein [Nevskia sp.]
MQVTIECHGASQRWCGAERFDLELPPGATVADALQALAARHPELAARRATLAVAIGEDIVDGARRLEPGAMLALIPPVSGG